MTWISVLLFIATLSLIVSFIYLDMAKYKFVFFGAIIALSVILYSYGLAYNGETLNGIDLVLKAFGNTTAILRGIFRTAEISNRINNDLLFLISAYAIHVIGFGYTYILIFAVFFNNLALKMRFYFVQNKPHYLILGDDEKVSYLLQAYEKESPKKRSGRKGINVALPKALLAAKNIDTKYTFKPGFTTFDISQQKLNAILRNHAQEVTLISLLTKDTDVMALVEKLNRFYRKNPNTRLKSYLLYQDRQHLPVYESFSEEKQRLRFFAYHQLIAQQLVMEYPLTSFIPQSFIVPERATLDDVTIKYHLLGFGQTNAEIYRHLFITNQFPPKTSKFFGKELTNYSNPPIVYKIYVDESHQAVSVPSFAQSIDTQRKNYLPMPPLSAKTERIDTSFADQRFLEQLEKQINKQDDYQVMVIAFDDDVINLRVLQQTLNWLVEKRMQQYHIFVQMLNKDYVQTSQLFKAKNVIPFGFGVYGYALNQIINPVFNQIARNIQTTLNPQQKFDELTAETKDSLLYQAISLRFKLNLMGLDLAPVEKGLLETNFMARYDEDEHTRFHASHPRAKNDADLNRYKPVAKKVRNLLARQEHLRWTADQLARGYIPMSLDELKTGKQFVDVALKKDARLTSFEGLFDLHRYLVEEVGFAFPDADIIYPFFHTLDYLYKIIEKTPFKVIDKIDEANNQTVELSLDTTASVESHIKS